MKLWQALDKAVKGLKIKFKGVEQTFIITIEDDPDIVIKKLESDKWYGGELRIDIRDWEKVKKAVDDLIGKEV